MSDQSQETPKKQYRRSIKLESYNSSFARILEQCSSLVSSRSQSIFHVGKMCPESSVKPIPTNLKEVLMLKKPHEETQNIRYLNKLYAKAKRKKKSDVTIRKTDLGEGDITLDQKQLRRLPNHDTTLIAKDVSYFPEISMVKAPSNAAATQNLREEIQKNLEWAGDGRTHSKSQRSRQNKLLKFVKKPVESPIKIRHLGQLRIKSLKQIHCYVRRPKKATGVFYRDSRREKSCAFFSELSTPLHDLDETCYGNDSGCIEKQDGASKILQKLNLSHLLYDSNAPGVQAFGTSSFQKRRTHELQAGLIGFLSRQKQTPYLTEERLQAIYECELLKGMKKILGRKKYSQLHLSLDRYEYGPQTEQEEEKKQPGEQKSGLFLSRNKHSAAQMLKKNQARVNIEKKRVIERLRC